MLKEESMESLGDVWWLRCEIMISPCDSSIHLTKSNNFVEEVDRFPTGIKKYVLDKALLSNGFKLRP